MLCLTGPVGIVLVRGANFINGELLGRIVAQPGQPAPWWSVRYPTELLERPLDVEAPERREAQLWQIVDEHSLMLPGETATDVLNRMLTRVRAGDEELIAAIEPILTSRHPTQLYQAFAEGALILVVLWAIWSAPRKPGVITAWFFVLYGVGRVITEIWRLPDAHLEVPRFLGMSRGQWLSVGLAIVGAFIFVRARGAAIERVGGWRRPNAVWKTGAEKKRRPRGSAVGV